MHTVRDVPAIENIPILVRGALNVPVENGKVVNDYRLRRAVPTLRFLAERGARIVLISHLGEKGTETLAPVAEALGHLIRGVSFTSAILGEEARAAVRALLPGNILVLENLRRDRRERENDRAFAEELASLADLFIEDCFDTCHRRHASIVGVPQFLPSYGGLLLEEEMHELSLALTPKRPSLAVIGGAKFNTKEPVLTALLKTYDEVFIGGALANDFLKKAGRQVGKSLVSATAEEADIERILNNSKLILPVDALVIHESARGSLNARAEARVVSTREVKEDDIILDHGPGTAALIAARAAHAATILWNGPLGNYENGFVDATNSFARAVAESSARSVVGGGDTVAAIERLGLLSHFSFVSTGGGAMLEFLAHGTLPGIDALMPR